MPLEPPDPDGQEVIFTGWSYWATSHTDITGAGSQHRQRPMSAPNGPVEKQLRRSAIFIAKTTRTRLAPLGAA
jgi:hypothetical protein